MTSLPQLAPATTPLHGLQPAEQHFSVLSYNVLLPNSGGGGWWVSKYYDDTTAPQHRTWAHRQALLRQTLLDAMADIVCLQEVVAETWDDDFGFMLEAGYASALHRKFRLRPATFWRSERWDEVVVRHKDKTLVTLLRERSTERLLAVINVHLTAAPQPKRRFQQLFEALDQVRKECFKLKHDPTTVAVVVCGDFNCNPEDTATDHLLCQGPIDPDFREPRWPEQQISSKVRGQPFGPFMDLVRTANGGTPMPTLIAVRLAEVFSTEGLASAIRAMFAQFAGEAEVMDREAVEAWVNRINGELRGSEYTKAQEVFAHKGAETLTSEELLSIYLSELHEGKYWSVHHDLQVCGVAPPVDKTLFETSLDRIYINTSVLRGVMVRDPLTPEQRQLLYDDKQGLPNAWHPSDHLPMSAVVGWVA